MERLKSIGADCISKEILVSKFYDERFPAASCILMASILNIQTSGRTDMLNSIQKQTLVLYLLHKGSIYKFTRSIYAVPQCGIEYNYI